MANEHNVGLKIVHNKNNHTLQVTAPYHPKFNDMMRSCGSIWDKQMNLWWAGDAHIETIRKAMRDAFGADDLMDTVHLKLTFLEDQGQLQKDYCLYDKVICHATGRNSGGSPGKDVHFLAGRPESGGSQKNWISVVPAGSVVVLNNVKRNLLDTVSLPSSIKVEIFAEQNNQTEYNYLALMRSISEAHILVKRVRYGKASIQDKAFQTSLEAAAAQIAFCLERIRTK